MASIDLLQREVRELRETIRANDGTNVATTPFVSRVDRLLESFYDDIGTVQTWRLADVLDLFLIKVLYVNRRSRDAETLGYLGRMLERYLRTSELRSGGSKTGSFIAYLSDLMEEAERPSGRFQNQFEACRKFADNALFVSGVFPQSLGRKRAGGRLRGAPHIDRAYVISMGRKYYEMAAGEELAEMVDLRETLLRLARFFDVYSEALNELSERYVMGIDMRIVANKMLDAFNAYRETGDATHLDAVRKYAALIKLDARQWPLLDELPADRGGW